MISLALSAGVELVLLFNCLDLSISLLAFVSIKPRSQVLSSVPWLMFPMVLESLSTFSGWFLFPHPVQTVGVYEKSILSRMAVRPRQTRHGPTLFTIRGIFLSDKLANTMTSPTTNIKMAKIRG